MSEGQDGEAQGKSKIKLPRFSAAFKFASIVAVSLLLLILFSWLLYCLSPDRVAWSDYMTLPRALGLLMLHGMCTLLAYWGAQLWFDEVPSPDQAGEKSFRHGVEAAREKGVEIRDLPINLILGVEDSERQAALIQNCGERIVVQGIGAANGICSWYVTEAAIHLFSSRAGVLGLVAKRVREQADNRFAGVGDGGHSIEQTLGELLDSAGSCSEAGDAIQSGVTQLEVGSPRANSQQPATVVAQGRAGGQVESAQSTAGVAVTDKPSANLAQGNAEVDAITARMEELTGMVEAEVSSDAVLIRRMKWKGTAESDPQGVVTSAERVACEQRMLELCSRLRASRRPVAPLNSVLVVVDGVSMLESTESAATLGEAVLSDLSLIESKLGVVAPTAVLVDGLERLPGFEELVKRLGPRVVSSALLGEANSPEQLCTRSLGSGVAQAAVRNVSDLITASVRDPSAFSIPGVRNLFKLRLLVADRLAENARRFLESVLRGGEASGRSHFSGLFFGAKGTRTSESAFFPGVFHRLAAQQELVEWNAIERRSQGIQAVVLRALQFQCAILVILLAIQIVGGL